MKKYLNFAFVLFAGLSVVLSCSKIEKEIDNPVVPAEEEVTVQDITLTAILPESDTKVSYEATYGTDFKPTAVTRKWETTDKLKIWNQDHSNSTVLDLDSGDGTNTAVFKGQIDFTSASYDIEVLSATECSDYAHQSQASDGDMSHIAFVAGQSGVTDLTAAITLTETSGVLAIIAQLPAGAAEEVTSIVISDLATGSPVIALLITNKGDADTDGVFKAYMNVTRGMSLAQYNEYLIRFNTPDATQKYYTRYYKMGSKKDLGDGKFQYLKLNCKHTDQHAGSPTACDGTSADKAYLIADGYQLAAINSYASTSEKTYFKLIDDIDMTGITHVPINEGVSGYTINVDFDGNNKTISKLGTSLFYVFKGSIKDLTLDNCSVSKRGIFAEYCQGSGNVVSNVTVSNGKVVCTGNNVGGLIGNINESGTSATITNCSVSVTDVSGAGVVGGVIGFADALVTISGCSYTGGTVKATARYAGGFIASAANYDSAISDCHIESATIESSSDRAGGFAGQLQAKVQVKGCTVGSSTQSVEVKSTRTAATANVGGFVGVNYGKITKNGDVRSKAFVKVTSSNTTTSNSMQIGGFVGYNTGTIEYSDAVVDMTNLKGQYIGGFCGILLQSGKIEKSTETGSVSGNNYTGGFVGVIDSATTSITDCSSAGSVTGASSIGGFAGGCTANNKPGQFIGNSSSATVTSSGSNFGGFIGNAVGTFTSNFATGEVASSGGGNGGGFAGGIWEGSTGSVFSKNYATGNVSGNANLGGFIGYIGGSLTMSDCFATGNVGNSTIKNQKYGGLVGFTSDDATKITAGVSISNCYATGNIIPSFAGGGLIGRIGLATTSVSKCAAWNASITPNNSGSSNWSSGAVVGVAFPKCTLTDNYRNPSMSLTAYWVPADMTTFQHADVSSAHPLTDSTGAEMTDTATASGQAHYPHYPYHGKVKAGKTLSELASTTLGWSGDVWDFTGDLPTLK